MRPILDYHNNLIYLGKNAPDAIVCHVLAIDPHQRISRALGELNHVTNGSHVPPILFLPRAKEYRGKNPSRLAGLQRLPVFSFVLYCSCQEVFAQSVQWANSYLEYYLCKRLKRLQSSLCQPTFYM